jgi:hypothetical protein
MKILSLTFIILCLLSAITEGAHGASEKRSVTVEQAITAFYPEPDASSCLTQSALSLIKEGIPPENVYRFVQAAAMNALTYEEVRYYMDIVGRFHKSGIPAELAMNTILEGIAKGVEGAKIRDALASTEKRLLFCSKIASSHAHGRHEKENKDLLAISLFNALNSGFQEGDLLLLSNEVRTQKRNARYLSVSVHAMMEIKNMGFRVQDIVKLIHACISNGFSVSDIRVYPRVVESLNEKAPKKELVIEELITQIENGQKPVSEKNATKSQTSSSSDSRTNQGTYSPPKGSGRNGKNSP